MIQAAAATPRSTVKKSHVTVRCVWNDDTQRAEVDNPIRFHAQMKRMGLGAGEVVVARYEREQDAKKHHQLKWYYGYIVKQCCAKTGYTVIEMDNLFRAEFLEPTVVTLSENTYEQMAEYNLNCERYAAEVIGVVIQGPNRARTYLAA